MSWQTVKTKAGPRLAVRIRAGGTPKGPNAGHRRRHRTIADTAIQAVQIMIVTSNNSIIAAPGFGDRLTRGVGKRSGGGRILRRWSVRCEGSRGE
jgi:hypothetical protein